MSEPTGTPELLTALEAQGRRFRRDLKARTIRYVRYMTRTPWAQQMAEEREAVRRVLERGFYPFRERFADGSGI